MSDSSVIEFDEARIDVIGPNGNDGLHYVTDIAIPLPVVEVFDAGAMGGGDIYAADEPIPDTTEAEPTFNKSGSKYLRKAACMIDGKLDVYAVIDAFDVTCPARQHAIKKLLCSGIRGKGDVIQDLNEARDAVDRAIQMQKSRVSDDEELSKAA